MQNLSKFCSNQSAKKVDQELKTALKIKDLAHQCSLDWFGEIYNRKLFRDLGFSTVNQYAREELGFSNSKTGHFITLTKKLDKLPELKNSISNGELGYTLGRVLVDIVDETNEKQWLDFAKSNSRRKVEDEVKKAKVEAKEKAKGQPSFLPKPKKKPLRAVLPVKVNLEMAPTQFARYEKLWEQVRKKRNISSEKVEALLEIMEGFLEETQEGKIAPRGAISRPSTQIHIHHCPECESSKVQTSKGELEISKADYERAQCDCQIEVSDGKNASEYEDVCIDPRHITKNSKRNKTSIPPAIRRRVLANARHKCETPGCGNTRFLEIHHLIPRSMGGINGPENLKCLCSACHRLAHGNHSSVKEQMPGYSFRPATIMASKQTNHQSPIILTKTRLALRPSNSP
ncbi:MAG: HNH endonuclease [bacterium]|nr:HNH endonuclease [bacterium]